MGERLIHRKMAYRNNKHHDRNLLLHHHHHHHKYDEYGAFKGSIKEDAIVAEVARKDLAETERNLERLRERDEKNEYVDVNEEAEAFIKLEHRRMDITGFMSMTMRAVSS